LWSNASTERDLTGVPAGTYSVKVTDANGDTASHSATVSEPVELSATFSKKNISKTGNSDGRIGVDASGGTPPYSYSWSNGATNDSLTGLAAGTYTVDVTDAHQATVHLEIAIYEPVSITFNVTDVTTFGGTNGGINVSVSGGLPPYTFEWAGGQTTEDISTLPAGMYSLSVTDMETSKATSSTQVFESYDKSTDAAAILQNVKRLKQSGIRIAYNSKIIYIDPINTGGYSADADLILITHNHSDHLNAAVIDALSKTGTKVLATDDCESALTGTVPAEDLQIVAPGQTDTVAGVSLEVVHAYNTNHVSPHCVGYILILNNVRVYHSGDTKKIPEMDSYNADVAFLPMGQTYTFATIDEAVEAAIAVNAEVVVPMHYGMYEGKTSDAWTFKDQAGSDFDVLVKPVLSE
jgi:L-ascorbate metabolism protein UlaG (beta-lactamase superfamily)